MKVAEAVTADETATAEEMEKEMVQETPEDGPWSFNTPPQQPSQGFHVMVSTRWLELVCVFIWFR
jgi:hypothetical protein